MQETEFQFAGAQGMELPARLWLPASFIRSKQVSEI